MSADYELTVQQKKAATTKNNYSGSTSAGASTVPSYTAPTQPVTPSAPAPAPAPAPDPAPAPAEPSQPSGGDYSGDSGFDPVLGSWSVGSGIDWTQDNSNGDNQTCEFGCT